MRKLALVCLLIALLAAGCGGGYGGGDTKPGSGTTTGSAGY